MATPISPISVGVLLTCGASLPVAAFLAALPAKKGKPKTLNVLGVFIGLLAISIVVFVMYQYR
jgi:hypothetical protein